MSLIREVPRNEATTHNNYSVVLILKGLLHPRYFNVPPHEINTIIKQMQTNDPFLFLGTTFVINKKQIMEMRFN